MTLTLNVLWTITSLVCHFASRLTWRSGRRDESQRVVDAAPGRCNTTSVLLGSGRQTSQELALYHNLERRLPLPTKPWLDGRPRTRTLPYVVHTHIQSRLIIAHLFFRQTKGPCPYCGWYHFDLGWSNMYEMTIRQTWDERLSLILFAKMDLSCGILCSDVHVTMVHSRQTCVVELKAISRLLQPPPCPKLNFKH